MSATVDEMLREYAVNAGWIYQSGCSRLLDGSVVPHVTAHAWGVTNMARWASVRDLREARAEAMVYSLGAIAAAWSSPPNIMLVPTRVMAILRDAPDMRSVLEGRFEPEEPPYEGPAVVKITDTTTGETRCHDEAEWMEFLWSEGNYSCDCNRSLFFKRAGGDIPATGIGESEPCGDSRYTIVAVDLEGRQIFEDTDR